MPLLISPSSSLATFPLFPNDLLVFLGTCHSITFLHDLVPLDIVWNGLLLSVWQISASPVTFLPL